MKAKTTHTMTEKTKSKAPRAKEGMGAPKAPSVPSIKDQASKATARKSPPRTEGLTDLDRKRAASLADEGGASAARVESESPRKSAAGAPPVADDADEGVEFEEDLTREKNPVETAHLSARNGVGALYDSSLDSADEDDEASERVYDSGLSAAPDGEQSSRGAGRRSQGSQRPWLFSIFALLIVASAAPVGAQTYLTPFAGLAMGGSTDDSKLTYGGDLAFTGHGLLGFSLDFGYTKDFFGDSRPGGRNNLTTLMGDIMFLTSRNKARLYASGGVGLLKTRVEDVPGFLDVDSNDWGMNAGAGVYIVGEGSIGFRGDVRYFRRLTDPEPDGEFDVDFGSLRYWRATAGVVFKF